MDIKKKLGSIASSSVSEDGSDDGIVEDLCATASQDLRMANLARMEFLGVLTDLETAWAWEERLMESRAARLKRESAESFEKMSPDALQRLRLDDDDEEDDDRRRRPTPGIQMPSGRFGGVENVNTSPGDLCLSI